MRFTCILFFLFTIFQTNAQVHKHIDKPKFAGIPLINYNQSFGGIFGAMGGLFFPLSKKDTISPASCAGGGVVITTNKTWFAFAGVKLYFKEDRFRTVIGGGTGDENFQYFNENLGTGSFVQYSTASKFFFAEQLIKVYGPLYMGLDYTFYNAKTTFENTADTSSSNFIAVGIPITVDSRDNIQNPLKGWFANAHINRFDTIFGGAQDYTKLDVDINNYFSKKNIYVFAWRASISTALGTVPFEAQTVVGGRVLRGYSKGEYRGDAVYSIQGEYRWNFYKKWGAVFFAGAATPVREGVTWSADDVLPGGGAGVRFMMIPSLRLNVGFDAALGKNDYGIYFRIGEAF